MKKQIFSLLGKFFSTKKLLFAALLTASFLAGAECKADAACPQIFISDILNSRTCQPALAYTERPVSDAPLLEAGNCNGNMKAAIELPTYNAQSKKPVFKYKKVTIQKGCKKKLKVKNATSCKNWKSKNKKIAKVSKKGVVTALKKGTTKISCKANGVKISCKVKVKGKKDKKSKGNTNDNSKGNTNSNSNSSSQETTATSHVESMLKLINKERAKQGLNALTTTTTLTSAANARAKEIHTSFAHVRPDGSSCFTILPEFGISAAYMGENIAYGQPTVASVMKAWMGSSGHRNNILSPDFNKVGIGRYKVGSTYYWVQIFTD